MVRFNAAVLKSPILTRSNVLSSYQNTEPNISKDCCKVMLGKMCVA